MGEGVEDLTAEQELLLRAALLRGPEGIEAWRAWRWGTNIDALDGDSQWLLPLLYHNLRAQGVSPGLLVRYRNVYLHNWYRNNMMLRRAEPAIRALQHAGGAVVLLGGWALALRHYEALGARPFGSLSVLAPVLADALDTPPRRADSGVDVRPSLFGTDTDETLIRRASAGKWKTMHWLVLDPADQLVDICLRRHAWDHRSKLFWAADAVTVVRRHPDLDWSTVAILAARVDPQADISNLLRWLADRFELGIPQAARCGAGPAFRDVSA